MTPLVPAEMIEKKILLIRGQKVMLDSDLAELYGIETKQLKRAVRRNSYRFPPDFMLELTKEENDSLRSQFGTLKRGEHSKYPPMVFTEQGVAMLSSVLNSRMAIEVNIMIMRAFVNLRWIVSSKKEFYKKLDEIEKKYDEQFKIVFDALRALMAPPVKPKRRIGFDLKEKQARYGKK
ncbi:MAG: ORF6N domain-containing protein [Thermodesulfobacteriota bacterium]